MDMSKVKSVLRQSVPILFVVLAFAVAWIAMAASHPELDKKIEAYNKGAEMLNEECTPEAFEKLTNATDILPARTEIDVRAKYNIGSLAVKCVLSGDADVEVLSTARHYLVEALREAKTIEHERGIDIDEAEIRKQLEIVNNYMVQEEMFDEGSGEPEDIEENGEENGEEEGGDEIPASGPEQEPPTPYRPEREY